jgi:prepilin-type N-terminal cleavage/methylation domain-containing protein
MVFTKTRTNNIYSSGWLNRLMGFRLRGFTLAELLVALAIFGLIATFTIPMVLVVVQQQHLNALAKETASILSEAYQKMRIARGTINQQTKSQDLIPYINFVKFMTAGFLLDYLYNSTGAAACGTQDCILLHNGAVLRFSGSFCNVVLIPSHQCAVGVLFDPDGVLTDGGSPTNLGKSIQFWVYQNGLLRDRGNTLIPTYSSNDNSYSYNPAPYANPPWFNW